MRLARQHSARRARYRGHMAEMRVRQLKEHLAEHLDRARNGEILCVTDRGRRKTLIGPMPDKGRIDRGVEEGWISPARQSGLRSIIRWKSRRTVLDSLADDRPAHEPSRS